MKNELVTFETAKLAKEKEFNISCKSKYIVLKTKTVFKTNSIRTSNSPKNNIILVPTQSLLQRWLRENYKLHIHMADLGLYLWSFMITELSIDGTQGKGGDLGKKNYSSYEEALEAGLYEALKLIKKT